MTFEKYRIRRVLRFGTALIGGLVLLSMTSSAQAAVPAAAGATPDATSNCARVVDYHNGSPLFSFVPGNGNYNLYFDNSGTATQFCKSVDSNANVQLYDSNGSEMCLALDSAAGIIHEATATACAGRAPYTEWLAIPIETGTPDPANGLVYELLNEFILPSGHSDCLYENTQRPAIYDDCIYGNKFEWIEWSPLGIHS
jgi:hypothetical protein